MSQIKVWGTGRPLPSFTEDDVLTAARKLFPKAKSAQIARFIAGKPFVITRVNDDGGAQRLIEGLAKSGIAASTTEPPAAAKAEAEAAADEDLEVEEQEELPPEPPAPRKPGLLAKKLKFVFAAVGLLVVAGAVVVIAQLRRDQAHEAAVQAKADADAKAKLAARREEEAESRRLAALDAADKEKAIAREAALQEKKEAAVMEMTREFEAKNYPQVIAMSERFEGMYGQDKRVEKMEQDATFTLKENARHGDFATILNAPIKNSVRYNQLRDWATQVQERAKPR